MIKQYEINISPQKRGFHLITSLVVNKIGKFPNEGLLHLFLQHTSAGITINENVDDDVRNDFESIINRLVPENSKLYHHTLEGPDDMPGHIKSSIIGQSLTIPITTGKLNLGTWQGIYLCEFRNNGGSRKIIATIYY
jgi:secondary thiamine-phosphate synthase enzyme